MAGYSFETITTDQAASFTVNDYLFFQSATASAVTVAPYSTQFGGSGTTISYGGKNVTFPDAISAASKAGHVLFSDNSSLVIGSNSTTASPETLVASNNTVNTVFYALNGNDTITLGATTNDFAYGGFGDDTIGGANANGNYHIYGNAAGTIPTSTQTDVDTITVGSGSSFIQGNAGNDVISAGTSASTGYNRIRGGADNDTITINGGLGAIDAVNGNKGADTINAGGSGTYEIHGGQDNDLIIQTGANRSTLYGDLGDDTIRVSATANHVAVVTGGAGNDVFDFHLAGAGAVAHLNSDGSTATTATSTNAFYQEVTDFGNGTDTVQLGFKVAAVNTSTTNFGTVADAQAFAQTQLNGTANSVSALSVGGQTYVFYHDQVTTSADGVIHMDGVATSGITTAAFSYTAPATTPTPA